MSVSGDPAYVIFTSVNAVGLPSGFHILIIADITEDSGRDCIHGLTPVELSWVI